jgi:ABC-2 type transport system permease protein
MKSRIPIVLKFEYIGYISAKSYKVMAILFAVLIIGLSFVPRIMSIVSEGGGEKEASETAIFLITGDAVGDPTVKQLFTGAALSQVMPTAKWVDGNEQGYTEATLKTAVEKGWADIAISYGGGASYKFFAPGNKLSAYTAMGPVGELVTYVAQQQAIAQLPADVQQRTSEIAQIVAEPELVEIGGNAENNFWIGYVLMFLLFYMIMGYSNFVSTSVVSEKSSKTMELLITAAKPFDLMVGKVVGVGLAALTQMAIILAAAVVGISANLSFWQEKYQGLFDLITTTNVSPALAVWIVVFFFLGFFLYAFLFAALSSTVSKAEEAASIITLPMMLLVLAFALGFISLSGALSKTLVVVLSYVPFFTPFVMVSRYCLGDVSMLGLIIGVLILLAGVLLVAWIAAKIYRVGVMMYGRPMKLIGLIKTLRQR